MKPEEIAALQENELRAHNPALAKAIEDAAKAPLEIQVGEQELQIQTQQPAVDQVAEIRKALKLDENGDVLEALGGLISKAKEVAKGAKSKYLDDILEKKFKDESTRNLVRRMLVTEMESGRLETEEDEESVSKAVNEFIDNDPDLKKMVSEMDGGSGASFGDGNGDRNTPKIEAGYENDLISVRKAGD